MGNRFRRIRRFVHMGLRVWLRRLRMLEEWRSGEDEE